MARYPVYRKRRPSRAKWLVLCLALAGAAVGLWAAFGRGGEDDGVEGVDRQVGDGENPTGTAVRDTGPNTSAPPSAAQRAAPSGPRRRRAQSDLQLGLRRSGEKERIIEARTLMSEALLSGLLSPAEQKTAVERLTKIADKTILSRSVDINDPYAQLYTILPGDVLAKVVRRLKLRIPWRVILKVNNRPWQGRQGERSARRIRGGDVLKVIHGPCHAIVYKNGHVMDLYLQRDKMPPAFLRRIRVGLGKDGTTPLGAWKVKSRLVHAKYYPAANSKHKAPIEYGEPDYPLGVKGLWIGLSGIDEKTKPMTSYGIHSTDAQNSIGGDQSEGCIRVGNADIDLVYAMLIEKWSRVEIRP